MSLKNKSIEVLNDSFLTYQETVENRLKKIEGENMKIENKSLGNNVTSEVTVGTRMNQLEQALRRLEMKNNSQVSETTIEDTQVQAIANYMRTGNISALESKSISYNTNEGGALLQGPALSKVFDAMAVAYPLIDKVNKAQASGRSMNVLVNESPMSSAMWYEEGTNVDETFKPQLTSKSVDLQTCMSVVDISRSMLEDMNDNSILDWVNQRVSADFATTVNEAILHGDQSVKGILQDRAIKAVNIKKDDLVTGLFELMSGLEDRYLNGAAWYISSSMFKQVLQTEQAGKSIFGKHLVESNSDGCAYKLFGKPVYLMKELKEDAPIMFANLTAGYTLIQHPNVRFMHKMTDAYAEKVRFMYRMRLGGLVTNKEAFVVGKMAK